MPKKKNRKTKEILSTTLRKGLPLNEFNFLSASVYLTPEDQTLTHDDIINRFFSIPKEYHRVRNLILKEAEEHHLSLLQGIISGYVDKQTEDAETKEEDSDNLQESKTKIDWKSSIQAFESGIEHECKSRPSAEGDPLEIMLGKRLFISKYFNSDHIFTLEPATLLLSLISELISSENLTELINLAKERNNGVLDEILSDRSKYYSRNDRSIYNNVIKNILYNKEGEALKLLEGKTTDYNELEKDSLELAARLGRSRVVSFCLDKLLTEIKKERGFASTDQAAEFGSTAISKIHKLNLEVIARGNIATCRAFLLCPDLWNFYTQEQQAEVLNTITTRSGINTMETLTEDLIGNNLLTIALIDRAQALALTDSEEKYIDKFLAQYAESLRLIEDVKLTTETLETILNNDNKFENNLDRDVQFAKFAYLYGKSRSTINAEEFVISNYERLNALAPKNKEETKLFRSYFIDAEICNPADELIRLIGAEELANTRASVSKSKKNSIDAAIEPRSPEEILNDSNQNKDIIFAELSLACRKFDKKGLEKFVKKNIERLREIKPVNQQEFEESHALEPSIITGSRKLIEQINAIKAKKEESSAKKAEISPLDRDIEIMLTGTEKNSLIQPNSWKNQSAHSQYKIFTAIIDHPDQNIQRSLLNELIREALLSSNMVFRAINEGKPLGVLHESLCAIERVKRNIREPEIILAASGDKAHRFAELAYAMSELSEAKAKKLITTKISQFKELTPTNIPEFEQLFIDKSIIAESRKLLELVSIVEQDIAEKQAVKARQEATAVKRIAPKAAEPSKKPAIVIATDTTTDTNKKPEAKPTALATSTAKEDKPIATTNIVANHTTIVTTKAEAKPTALDTSTAKEDKPIATTNIVANPATIVTTKAEAKPTALDTSTAKEDKPIATTNIVANHTTIVASQTAEVKPTPIITETVKEAPTKDNNTSITPVVASQNTSTATINPAQNAQQQPKTQYEIFEEINRLIAEKEKIESQLATLNNMLGYGSEIPRNTFSYLTKSGERIVGEYRNHPVYGPMNYTQNMTTGEIRLAPQDPGWASRVKPDAVTTDNKVAQILAQGSGGNNVAQILSKGPRDFRTTEIDRTANAKSQEIV